MTISVERTATVDAPIERVFEYLADARNEARWNPNVVRIDKVTAGPVGVGTVYDGDYVRGGRMRFRVTEVDRPSRVVFEGGGREMALVATVVLRGDDTTTVCMRADIRLRGVRRLLTPVARPIIERQYTDVVARFRAAVEERAERPDAEPRG